jgi:hypothetical protein
LVAFEEKKEPPGNQSGKKVHSRGSALASASAPIQQQEAQIPAFSPNRHFGEPSAYVTSVEHHHFDLSLKDFSNESSAWDLP